MGNYYLSFKKIMPVRLYEQGMYYIGSQFRNQLNTKAVQYPWNHYVRLAYFDAVTYGGSGQGMKAAWRINQFARAPHNRPLMNLANELELMKNKANVCFDKTSNADYAVAGAMTTITWAGGPVMLDDFFYGRKDAASESECNDISNVPHAGNYAENMMAKGFTAEQVVALANCEAFGVVRSPNNVRWSNHPRFDNYYYQALLTAGDEENLPLQKALMGNEELRGIVEQFAGDKEEFFKVFKTAFV